MSQQWEEVSYELGRHHKCTWGGVQHHDVTSMSYRHLRRSVTHSLSGIFSRAEISCTICLFQTVDSCLLYNFLSGYLFDFSCFFLFSRHPHCYWGSFVSPFCLSFLFLLVHLHYCCNVPFFHASCLSLSLSLSHLVYFFSYYHHHHCASSSFVLHHCSFRAFASCIQICCCHVLLHQKPDHIFIYQVKKHSLVKISVIAENKQSDFNVFILI